MISIVINVTQKKKIGVSMDHPLQSSDIFWSALSQATVTKLFEYLALYLSLSKLFTFVSGVIFASSLHKILM